MGLQCIIEAFHALIKYLHIYGSACPQVKEYGTWKVDKYMTFDLKINGTLLYVGETECGVTKNFSKKSKFHLKPILSCWVFVLAPTQMPQVT